MRSVQTRSFLFALICVTAFAGCRDHSGPKTEAERLERAARTALEEGHPRLAWLLVQKALEMKGASTEGLIIGARGAAAVGRIDMAHGLLLEATEAGLTSATALEVPELMPLRQDPAYPQLLQRIEANARQAPLSFGTALEESTPEAAGIDPEALKRLLAEAEASHSSALVVLRHGRLVGHWTFGGPSRRIEAMSATKSMLGLAVGMLLDDGKLRSIDQPVADFFPEWRGTPKEAITVRHLLGQTSGLASRRTTETLYAASDMVRHALQQPLEHPPGTAWVYNNSGCNLLAAVIGRAAGEPLDVYLHHRLFEPMGIQDVTWSRDPAGNRHGMSGMQIHPIDFAKVGQLVLQRGRWGDRQLISAPWFDALAEPALPSAPEYGLTWWRIPARADLSMNAALFQELRERGVPEETVQALELHRGRSVSLPMLLDLLKPYQLAQLRRLTERGTFSKHAAVGAFVGLAAKGYRGQLLFVFPETELVVVRMSDDWTVPDSVVEAGALLDRVLALVPSSSPTSERETAHEQ